MGGLGGGRGGRSDDPPPGEVLRAGAQAAGGIVEELRTHARARDLEVGPAALQVAGRLARARPLAPDGALERNQALRFALLDAEHVLTLIDYLAELALADEDVEGHAVCAAWASRLRPIERNMRRHAVDLGKDPDAAVEPISVAHKLQYAIGWIGEATDRLRRPRGGPRT